MPPIRTEFIHPPIGARCFDWEAVLNGYEPGDPIGYGATEQDAIDELLAQLEDA